MQIPYDIFEIISFNLMKPTLLILAAGMGSRYGGLKQVEPIGPNGEVIMDYSIYDAIRAGFGKVVFVIRKSFAGEFKELFDHKLRGKIETEYVFQELEYLPEGYSVPPDRKKPWGTAHAILVTKDVIKEPFCQLNADDFYGYKAFRSMAGFLSGSLKPHQYSMIGYKLRNTLSEFGSVSRGICDVDPDNYLQKIVETTKIYKERGEIVSLEPDGDVRYLTGDESVSMNIWGFQPDIFKIIEEKFIKFLDYNGHLPKSEIFIPSVVYEIITEQRATVEVLKGDSLWFGVTYQEDKPYVVSRVRKLIEDGEYPEKLF
ncbi:MAG: sugar phosphate nucleotidyltransferase [Prolixibacteraceae bacterium]|nr:sugar phosphate nucleotidyltransferase [Prolixibacteraceae bacterium]